MGGRGGEGCTATLHTMAGANGMLACSTCMRSGWSGRSSLETTGRAVACLQAPRSEQAEQATVAIGQWRTWAVAEVSSARVSMRGYHGLERRARPSGGRGAKGSTLAVLVEMGQ
jgi:hypothetical protein